MSQSFIHARRSQVFCKGTVLNVTRICRALGSRICRALGSRICRALVSRICRALGSNSGLRTKGAYVDMINIPPHVWYMHPSLNRPISRKSIVEIYHRCNGGCFHVPKPIPWHETSHWWWYFYIRKRSVIWFSLPMPGALRKNSHYIYGAWM